MLVVAPSASANTPNLSNGCKASTTPGAEMGQYPAWPGSQSYLRVACIFNHSTGGTGDFVSSTYTIHDFGNVVWHNGAARTITNTAAIAVGATTFTATDCTSATGFVNRTISSTVAGGLDVQSFVTSISGACLVTLNRPTVGAIPAGTSFRIDNAISRAVDDATVSTVAPNITSLKANFTAADNGLSVTGSDIPNGATLTVVSATQANVSIAPTAPSAAATVTFGGSLDNTVGPITTTRTVNDATSTATTISSPAAKFQPSDIGLKVSGPGITQPCYIASRVVLTATLSSACATANATAHVVTIGDPTVTAPAVTDTVLNQAVQLPLDPGLVAGSPNCNRDESSGFGIEGTWLNPGSFFTGALGFATQPPNTKAIGEVLFTTSVIKFGAYVIEMPNATDPLIGVPHYNLVFPNVPTTLALCASTPTSPGLGFSVGVNGTTVSAAALPSGTGRPGTAQLRNTKASTTGSTTTIFITDDVNGPGVKWTGSEFNRICGIAAGTPDINFVCGDG